MNNNHNHENHCANGHEHGHHGALCWAFTVGSAAATFFILCALIAYLWPEQAATLMAHLMHTDKLTFPINVTLMNTISGTVQVFVSAFIITWLSIFIISRCPKKDCCC